MIVRVTGTPANWHYCRGSLRVAMLGAALAVSVVSIFFSAAMGKTIPISSGGTVTTTDDDVYLDYTHQPTQIGGAYSGGGGFTLKANTTGNGDSIVIQNATVNAWRDSVTASGRAIEIGPGTGRFRKLASSGSYSVALHGSTLTGMLGFGQSAFFAQTTAGTITLDTTGGAPNTLKGDKGYMLGGSGSEDVSVVVNLGADQITTSRNYSTTGLEVGPTGSGSATIDLWGTTITASGVPDITPGKPELSTYVAGVFVSGGSGNITLGALNGGLSGTITVPNSYGIQLDSSGGTTRVTLSSAETIIAMGGISLGHSPDALVDSYGTIVASSSPAVTGNSATETVTLEGGSRTVGKIQASQADGSRNIFNIYTGADIGGASFEGNPAGSNTIYLKGAGAAVFDLDTSTFIQTIQKGDSGTWTVSGNSGSSTTFVVNAGTLEIADTVGVIGGNITNDATLIVNRSTDFAYAGVLSGSGALVKTGNGTLTLNGINTLSGATTVTSGKLVVGDAAHYSAVLDSRGGGLTLASGTTLSGIGTILGLVTNAGGTVAPGSIGTLTVNSYTQSATGTLSIEVTPSGSSRLNVIGGAQLNGTLVVNLDSGAYAPHVYSILTANNISGVFSTFTVTGTGSQLVSALAYATNGRDLNLLVSPTTAGQIYGDLRKTTFDAAFSLNDLTMNHLADRSCRITTSNPASCSRWSVWLQGLGASGHTNGDDSVSAINTRLVGVIGGADYQFESGISVHAIISLSRSDLTVSRKAQTGTTDTVYTSLGGHTSLAGLQLDAAAFFLQNNTRVTRDTEYSGIASSTPDSSVFGFSVQAGLPLLQGDLTPTVRFTYAAMDGAATNETAGGALGLAIYSASEEQSRGDFGLRLSHSYFTADGIILTPMLDVFLDETFGSRAPGAAMRLIEAANTDFVAPSVSPDPTAALVHTGLKTLLGGGWNTQLDITSRIGSNHNEFTGSAGVVWQF